MKWISLLALLITIGCSSTKDDVADKKHEDLEKNYKVRDASSNYRPGWIVNANLWAKKNGVDVTKYRYFSFETGPKVDRDIACNMAKANSKVDIAGEISSYIEKELLSRQEGDAFIDENSPEDKKLLHFVSNVLVERIQSNLHGVAIGKTYWEKRSYEKDLGAKKDFTAYTCAVFVKINKDALAEAVEKASKRVVKEARKSGKDKQVERILKDAPDGFEIQGT
ncbi:MAG: hypothetical protein E2O68_09810 [Deltaproteobacteria bacterium]|nr:MAG: hypothetical protein E2O68_09810 [Deltaproteobacteria bacterium]